MLASGEGTNSDGFIVYSKPIQRAYVMTQVP